MIQWMHALSKHWVMTLLMGALTLSFVVWGMGLNQFDMGGSSQVATVPLFNLWTIWWNADRLRHGLKDYWDAPIFYPERDTFAFSEPQPTTMIRRAPGRSARSRSRCAILRAKPLFPIIGKRKPA